MATMQAAGGRSTLDLQRVGRALNLEVGGELDLGTRSGLDVRRGAHVSLLPPDAELPRRVTELTRLVAA